MKFYGQQVYLGPKDKETLYYLIIESSLPEDQKERLSSKLLGHYLNDETYQKGLLAQKRNEVARKKRMKALGMLFK